MAQILDSLSSEDSSRSDRSYVNATSILQIVRITNITNCYFECVVFPGMRLFFDAPQMAKLEIYTDDTPSTILADKIPCGSLQVSEGIGIGIKHCTDGHSHGGKECFVESTWRR